MELCAGTLPELIEGTLKQPYLWPLELLLQNTASSMNFQYERHIMRRDIKLEKNIMIP